MKVKCIYLQKQTNSNVPFVYKTEIVHFHFYFILLKTAYIFTTETKNNFTFDFSSPVFERNVENSFKYEINFLVALKMYKNILYCLTSLSRRKKMR